MSDMKYVTYEEFGAVGDGVTDDYAAICKAHDYANENGLPVKANDSATYYICNPIIDGAMRSAIIKTDVEWGSAKFIIDDTPIRYDDPEKKWHGHAIFKVLSDYDMYKIDDEKTLAEVSAAAITRKSTRVALKLGYPAMIIPYSSAHKVFRRPGYGSWAGEPMHELIVIDGDGNISEETPVMFDYEGIDYIDVIRLDVKPLTVKGGIFTTLACRENILRRKENGDPYYRGAYIFRGILVNRSYTTVKGVQHYVEGEISPGEQVDENGVLVAVMYAASGFYKATNGEHITFEDCIMTGRRRSEQMGSYEISGNCVNKIVFKNCKQSNFWVTLDEEHRVHSAPEGTPGALTSMSGYTVRGHALMLHWGCGGTNFCKNMEYIDCTLSRFDAHCGLYHGKIVNSTLNGLEVVGCGNLVFENSRLFGRSASQNAGAGNVIFYLRGDYGCTWQGEMTVKDLDVYAITAPDTSPYIFYHSFSNWYFGYQAYFPNLHVENLRYFDAKTGLALPEGTEIRLFGNSLDREPMMHAPKTLKTPARFPDVDEDGDGLVDGTNIPYDDEIDRRGIVDPDCFDNHNPIMPPEYIKVLGNEGAGYKFVIHDTSEYEGGGFFGKTEFVSDGGTVVGTANKENDTFKFKKIEV